MPEVRVHPEKVKAAIRIASGTIDAFAEANGLKSQAVRDYLRGQSSSARPAVAKLLGVEADHLVVSRRSTKVEKASSRAGAAHRLNAGAR